jgi:hypothetical protein
MFLVVKSNKQVVELPRLLAQPQQPQLLLLLHLVHLQQVVELQRLLHPQQVVVVELQRLLHPQQVVERLLHLQQVVELLRLLRLQQVVVAQHLVEHVVLHPLELLLRLQQVELQLLLLHLLLRHLHHQEVVAHLQHLTQGVFHQHGLLRLIHVMRHLMRHLKCLRRLSVSTLTAITGQRLFHHNYQWLVQR